MGLSCFFSLCCWFLTQTTYHAAVIITSSSAGMNTSSGVQTRASRADWSNRATVEFAMKVRKLFVVHSEGELFYSRPRRKKCHVSDVAETMRLIEVLRLLS
ncbi:hypothetical protein B0H14DRAFT_2825566 [Mycena olivaceomarginata]|nr:hypothetical protein B0H14DRAFT_2825566 [Mycena olivaceomarginata]